MRMGKTDQMNEACSPLEDEDLIRRCVEGDRISREKLAMACLPRVRKTVFMTAGRTPDADDLVQVSMTRVFGGLARFRMESKLTTWIDRITINTVREHYRRKPIVGLFPGGDWREDRPTPERLGPDRVLEGRRVTDALSSHLSHIRPKKRMALVLSVAYGYSVSEIATMVGCTVETAKKRLQHGRRELLDRLRKDPYLSGVLQEIES